MGRWFGLVALLALGFLVAAFVPLGASGARSVAAQFHAPADAEPSAERVTPRRFVCLGASPCPSLYRSWNLPHLLARTDFGGLTTGSDWTLRLEGDCRPRPNSFARVAVCSAVGEVDGWAVTVNQLGDSRSETAVLTLDVRPLH